METIQTNVVNVLWRVALFVLYYTLLMCCGVAMIMGAIYVTMWIFVDLLPSFEYINFRLLLYGGAILVAAWGFVLTFAKSLVKALFAVKKNENDNRVEITEEDAPQLFKCIADIAQSTGCKMPKHVYLTTDVNACVFFDTSFWSIFFPVRKNLEIGLGLFQATSVEEMKSIIAHEFGHFAQGSMKVGSTVYVVNSILYDLVYNSDISNIVKRMNIKVYRFVERANMGLSRQMEYDADNVSCGIVGKEVFISALCKVEVTSQFQSLYDQFLFHLNDTGKNIFDYWKGYDVVKGLVANRFSYTFDAQTRLKSPIVVKLQSRITMDSVWASHPDLERRIDNVSKSDCHSSKECASAWSLIPNKLKKEISTFRLNRMGVKLEMLNDDEFKAWVANEIEQYFIPLKLCPFVDRNIVLFNQPTEEETKEKIDNPFTEENAAVLEEYEVGVKDWNLLNAYANRKIEANLFTYCGVNYRPCDSLPIEEHRIYMEKLYPKVQKIDRDVYLYIAQNSNNPNNVHFAYCNIFSSARVLPTLNSYVTAKNSIVETWNRKTEPDKYDYASLIDSLNKVIWGLQHFLMENADMELLRSGLDKDDYNRICGFVTANMLTTDSTAEDVNFYCQTMDMYVTIYQNMANYGKRSLVQEANKVFENVTNKETTK